MVVENFPEIIDWLFGDGQTTGAIFVFLLVLLVAVLLGLFAGFVIASFRSGPGEAFYSVARVVAGAGPDWFRMSPRRIGAIARLAIKEASRRRVILIAFLIFSVMLLFGGWFLGTGEHPDRVYINFVMWGSQLLILMLVMLISAFSLPDDIRNRTIYTVATKPVRTSELVLGRVLGFTAIGTGLLLLMGLVSLLFVWRGLSHTHEIAVGEDGRVRFGEVDRKTSGHRASENALLETRTTVESSHQHFVEIIEDVRRAGDPPPGDAASIISQEQRGDTMVYKRLQVSHDAGHSHAISVSGEGNDAEYELSDARGFFRARKPLYAERLIFFGREGEPRREGFNVGDQWTYRGFVDGGVSLARAEYLFEDFDPDDFSNPDILPLELTLGAFRTVTGDIHKRIRAGLQFEGYVGEGEAIPARRFRSELIEFETEEFAIQVKGIPRKIPGQIYGPKGELLESGVYDLFDDFAPQGRLKLIVRCLDEGQYLGMARADIYFRVAEQAYWWNFVRGWLGIWMQMLIVASLGVAFSTFLTAPVTMLGTICAIIFGFFSESIRKLALGEISGGGPIESFYRMVTQMNQEVKLADTAGVQIMKSIDSVFIGMIGAVTRIVPDFSTLDFSRFLTYGYYVDNDRILVALLVTVAFCVGATVAGYFCLKTRELAG